MGYFIAIIVVWIMGVIGVLSERSNPSIAKLEAHEKMRITGLTFIGFAIVSSLPAIALILLAVQLGFN
ncbi:hypothetical protein DS745_17775 [Anaerobacillus alkaliphilus]|uniref:Uncharacterized protein n=1 Tax=Anaerobacillus alkaliphilus TaxID=1548597 RepID=A0A4Q0VPV0_9BACI|nr:hypothetical protein [Anaerobacillus alkaliphilus]RXI98189.1 hypothetical protein DS745_17775 [Anaerobacillus alkaliphilus]